MERQQHWLRRRGPNGWRCPSSHWFDRSRLECVDEASHCIGVHIEQNDALQWAFARCALQILTDALHDDVCGGLDRPAEDASAKSYDADTTHSVHIGLLHAVVTASL
jgi:hypothetical protein